MLSRRALLGLGATSAVALTVRPALAFGPIHGSPRVVTVDPFGDICANATVWLDTGPHRLCLWSACAGPVPSVAPSTRQLLSGVIAVEVEGQTVARASTRAWSNGQMIPVPGQGAGLRIQTARAAIPDETLNEINTLDSTPQPAA